LREVAWPCGLAFVVVCFLGVANQLRERMDQFDSDIIQLTDFARLAFYFIPTIFTFVIPITFMMAILFAFSSLAQHNEITAMRAAGIPLKRLVLPIIAAGLVLTSVSFVLQDRVQPWAMQRAHHLLFTELLFRKTLDVLPPGKMHSLSDGQWRVYFASKDEATGTLNNIDIFTTADDGRIEMLHFETAQVAIEGGQTTVTLKNGHMMQPSQERDVLTRTPLLTQQGPTLTARAVKLPRSGKTIAELWKEEADLSSQHVATRNDRIASALRGVRRELAARFSLPLACLSVAFAAAPLAIRRRGGGRSYTFAIGLAIGLSFYLIMMVAEPSGLRSMSEVMIRALAPNIVLCIVGSFFLWRVDRI
jgi:lipopolysaccharide export LptBFGC system permease protein LptF